MAITVQQMHPVAHLPLVLGVLRRLEVATVAQFLAVCSAYILLETLCRTASLAS